MEDSCPENNRTVNEMDLQHVFRVVSPDDSQSERMGSTLL